MEWRMALRWGEARWLYSARVDAAVPRIVEEKEEEGVEDEEEGVEDEEEESDDVYIKSDCNVFWDKSPTEGPTVTKTDSTKALQPQGNSSKLK